MNIQSNSLNKQKIKFNSWNCQQHSQPIIAYIQNEQPGKGLCWQCLDQQTSTFSFTPLAYQQLDQYVQWFLSSFDVNHQQYVTQLKSLLQQISEIKSFFNQSIDKLSSNISDWITASSKQKEHNKQRLQSVKGPLSYVIKGTITTWKEKEKKFKQSMFQQIQKILSKEWIVDGVKKLKEIQPISLFSENQQQIYKKEKISYQLCPQSIKQDEGCQSLSFNKDNNILVCGSHEDLKIFKFDNGNLTQIQLLKETGTTYALYIGNNNQIFQCCDDNTIKIWVQEGEWKLHQKLNEHSGPVHCIVLNKAEDLLITGSEDQSIKCWNYKNQWQLQQTLQDHKGSIYALNLSESSNQLISWGFDKVFNIYTREMNWKLVQTFQDILIRRALFLNEDLIACQISFGGLRLFEKQLNKFVPKCYVPVNGTGGCEWFFPQVFCKQEGIFVNKNCKVINIFRIKKDYTFKLEQAIEFKTSHLYGTLTHDGQYLVTWDDISHEIQVRYLE